MMTATKDRTAEVREAFDSLEVDPLTVHEAVAAVLSELPAIPKNGQAPGNMGGYAFRRVEDITGALKPLFAKHGVLCLPNVMSRIESQRATAKGGVMFCVDLEICFRFVGPQGDELAANVWGQGTDSGDKATQKAVTSAFKTMLSVVFCISDSEMDAEAHDVPETQRAPAHVPAAEERVERIKTLVLERDIAEWVKAQNFTWPWSDIACNAIQDYAANTMPRNPGPPAEPVMTREDSKANEAAKAEAEPTHCPECGAGPLEAHAEGCSIAPF